MTIRPDTAKFKVLIFDLFHTLSSIHHSNVPGRNSHEIIGISRDKWLDALFTDHERRARGHIKDPIGIIRDITDKLDMDLTEEQICELAQSRYDRFSYSLKNILPHTVETIKELKRRGKMIILLSNADVCEVESWEHSPLAEHFDHAVFSCHTGYLKPEREIYDHAVKLSGYAHEECLFIGDGGSDELTGAKNAGIAACFTSEFIKDLWPEHVEPRRLIADYHIDRIDELL
ncbi:MAG: HAD family hydrolase [Candidatus Delongbacteria bacterium]|jgi:putative hydrolase of the HAD superfamily|nr:HAD family hydrolase [Candidatus Delongbacteria bacterium]